MCIFVVKNWQIPIETPKTLNMTKEQRTATARIISDMIKADNIIEESEIKDMKKLMSEYSITHQEMSDARKIRFSDAVNTLKELSIKKRKVSSQASFWFLRSEGVARG